MTQEKLPHRKELCLQSDAASSRSGVFLCRLSFFIIDVSLRIFHCAFLLPGYNEEKTQKAKRGYRT